MCFSPQRRASFQHLNVQKCSENAVFCTFSLQNVLLATAACNFSTSQLQKVLRTWHVLYIFTWKCASRHSGVQFFNSSTSKSGPKLTCFVHFYLKMCFSPQRRAIFQHLNFKKCSEPDMFCTFSLENVLLATAACYFWFLFWPHDSAPAALTSLLFDSPDTRIIGKTQRFATSLTFGAGESSFFWLSRYCIFFLLTLLHLLTLLSADFTSSICFSSAFQLSILSEVYYLNFLRLEVQPKNWLSNPRTRHAQIWRKNKENMFCQVICQLKKIMDIGLKEPSKFTCTFSFQSLRPCHESTNIWDLVFKFPGLIRIRPDTWWHMWSRHLDVLTQFVATKKFSTSQGCVGFLLFLILKWNKTSGVTGRKTRPACEELQISAKLDCWTLLLSINYIFLDLQMW